jgi:hypothetical protein
MNYAKAWAPLDAQTMAGAPRLPIDCLAPTIFHQPWWLEIATRGRYAVAEARHNGRVVGRMPYCLTRQLGGVSSTMPMLTHFLGPATDDGDGTPTARWLRRQTITQALLAQLPAVGLFRQKLHRGIGDVLAFQAEGYDTSVQFTHEIAPQPEDVIWDAMRDKTRNMVRKAARTFRCDMIDDPELFARFYADNLTARGKANYTDMAVTRDLIAACLARDCGRIYAARHSDGSIVAAAFCAWDDVSCYYLMATRCADGGNSPSTFLLWNAIRDAARRGLVFDFDGVSTAGAVLFYAGFGASIAPRYIVAKVARHRRLWMATRQLVARPHARFL